ncbi:hypothetical protein BpHYR1_002561 [Brachionus plicatilis]|uniref:Uncharacterized protein n=1 Tax=Brachionus plicatilis TaxID=10195 RepID=A0A3M7RGM5_BRAPC|nr:hypothetical protein BpHYR1_002561 [Brachionus plicatilis]
MMVRNDPPIYSQNNNIPIVVGTQLGHTVQLLVRQLFTTRMVHLKSRVSSDDGNILVKIWKYISEGKEIVSIIKYPFYVTAKK